VFGKNSKSPHGRCVSPVVGSQPLASSTAKATSPGAFLLLDSLLQEMKCDKNAHYIKKFVENI